jgi:undecaprenyl diphosphate synthase
MHVALIPDGNRRWAVLKNLEVIEGHKAGAKTLEKIVRFILTKEEITYFTVWALSLDNLKKRQLEELIFLNRLFVDYLQRLTQDRDVHLHQVKIMILGEWQNYLPSEVQERAFEAMEATKNYRKRFLTILLAYDGISEMVEAVRKVSEKARRDPQLEISADLLRENLITKDLPAVDLLIRTGGEPHFSAGFMMWHLANAQLYFSDKLWPDFTPLDFESALIAYNLRQRRFGT